MASITKRKAYWRAQVRVVGYPSISRTFDTKAKAQAWARHTEGQIDRGHFRSLGEAESITLHDALDRYFREVGSRKRHPTQEHQRVKQWQRHALVKRYWKVGRMRQVLVRGIKKVDQIFVLTMAGYNLTRLRSLGQIRLQEHR